MKKIIATIAAGALIFSMVASSMAFAQEKEAVEVVKATTAAEETATSGAATAAALGAGTLALIGGVAAIALIAVTVSESGSSGHGTSED